MELLSAEDDESLPQAVIKSRDDSPMANVNAFVGLVRKVFLKFI